ncbi:conserved hypothetical protein [Theileria orientalis strain Shintoku]|uniref:Mcm6 C-terminal winged-helix domain-containing protein n=1 Tax=Theileria orientalis strain Shintoku TaxID=869250 RepID=J4C325_THEOR|nr:conserved hypothetical protein [Theileria orientalis strain Shintoku]PVC52472.1 hypothetical protein MACL_00000743 [Theileria orientalis]BAM39701.1 conserved hypothetical protein [Theileria orientalis strain Shintoku]|eukprot:XP_009690002.1 conserved hypothetical protein [Theileria orientalis strain Shintoku]
MSTLDLHKNLVVEYNSYVHFAYYVGKYLLQKCQGESCNEKTIVSWYLENPGKFVNDNSYSYDKLKVIYEKLVDNLINDGCVLVISEESGSRVIKRHPEFFVWAWKSLAKLHHHKLNN